MSDGVVIPPSHGAREILPAESYVGNAWKALEVGGGPKSEIAEAFHRMKVEERDGAVRAAVRLLEDASLRPLLEFLTDMTLRRPVALGVTKEDWLLAQRREGANGVVWVLYQLIAEARGQMPPPREGL
jgi:hypothetical protein